MSTNPNNLVPMPTKVWSDTPTPPRREVLWIAEGKVCHWCKKPTRLLKCLLPGSKDLHAWDQATIDHVIPRYKGGTNDDSNLVSACRLCNNRRSHEDNCGLPEGSLLGKYDPDKGILPKNCIVLTGDEKKAILAAPKKRTIEDNLREQRDQAHNEIHSLRLQRDNKQIEIDRLNKELKVYKQVVDAQEKELNELKEF